MRARRLLLPGLALAMALAGCGVPTDDGARSIPRGEVAYDLLAPSTTVPPTTVVAATAGIEVFVLGQDRLVAVRRSVAAPPMIGAALAALIQGPNDQEAASGLVSSVSPQARVVSAEVNGTTAVVNMNEAFTAIAIQDQVRALAQVVYTATALPGISDVQVQVDAIAVEVPRGDGSTASGPLTRENYASFAPLRS